MGKIITYFKRDFESVYWAINYGRTKKIPKWVIFVYYVIVSPIALIILPFVQVWSWHNLKKLRKEFYDLFKD